MIRKVLRSDFGLTTMVADPTILAVLICSLVTLILVLIKRRHAFWKERNIPGPEPGLIYGNLNRTKQEAHMFVHQKWIQKYGKVVGAFDFLKPKLIIADADLVKKMLVQDFGQIANRRTDPFNHPFERKFSFIQEYDEWKKARTVLSSIFSLGKMKIMFDQAQSCTGKLKDHLDYLASSPQGKDINAEHIFNKYLSDTITRSLYNVSVIESYSESCDQMGDSILKYAIIGNLKWYIGLILPAWLQTALHFSVFNIRALDYPISFVSHIIKERRGMSIDSPDNDIVKSIIISAEKHKWGEDEMLANLVGLYLAGLLTTNVNLSYFVYVLAKYPHVQRNLIKELDQFEETNQPLTFECINKNFPYLDAVICEIQRMWSSSTYTERLVSAKEYTFSYDGKNFTIPKNTRVYFPIFVIHRHPDFYENPDEFDETRFLPQNRHKLNPYAFLPFGQGPRNCTGYRLALNNIKSAILAIVKSYKFHLVDPDNDPMGDLNDTMDEILTPKPIRVRIEKIIP